VRFLTFYLVEKSAQKSDVNFVSIVEYVQKLHSVTSDVVISDNQMSDPVNAAAQSSCGY
jgi:hypothetical protein